MLELFGADYVIDHVMIEIKKYSEERSYKIYISDALRAITNNHAQIAVEQRSYIMLQERWIDVVDSQKKPSEIKEDTRSCKEIVDDMWKRIKGKGEK